MQNTVLEQMPIHKRLGYGRLLAISLPIVAQNLSYTLMTFFDRFFMSKYDLNQFAAVVPASSLGFTFSAFFYGVVWYISTMVAQYYGSGHTEKLHWPMWAGIWFSTVSCAILLLMLPFSQQFFKWFHQDPILLPHQATYFRYMLIATMFNLFSASLGGFFSGIGKTSIAMLGAIIGNITNVILDYWLIFGSLSVPAMGINGAGLATSLGALVNLLVILGFIVYAQKQYRGILRPVWQTAVFKRLMRFGTPVAAQMLVESIGFSLLLMFMGQIGWAPTAAAGIVFTVQMFCFFPILSLGTGCSIVVGQERGAKHMKSIDIILRRGLVLALIYTLVWVFALLVFPRELAYGLFRNAQNPEKTREILSYVVPMMQAAAVWIIFDAFFNIYSQVLKALGDTLYIMLMLMIMTPVVKIIPALLISTYMPNPYLLMWVIVAYSLTLFVAAILRYHSHAWEKFHVIEDA